MNNTHMNNTNNDHDTPTSYMDFSQSRTTEPMSISLPLSNLEYLSLQDTNLIIQNERVFHNMLNLKVVHLIYIYIRVCVCVCELVSLSYVYITIKIRGTLPILRQTMKTTIFH